MSLPINKFDMSTIKHRNNSGITDNSGNIIEIKNNECISKGYKFNSINIYFGLSKYSLPPQLLNNHMFLLLGTIDAKR
jgi:hypothetical protein